MNNMDTSRAAKERSDETEFYTPLPDGYRVGAVKYVAIMGTVLSGLGKGIFSSSLAKLMKDKGLRVSPMKVEGYLNIDSGTLNPVRHGEVFVLDDGMETDMDLGTYERMLDQDLSRANFATSGQIYTEILRKERQGEYKGRDVQMIPHVTGEVKYRLRDLAVKSKADVVFVEVGGTVGDIENAFYLEALRELSYEEGEGSVVFVALTYVLEPSSLGEQKSKAAQLGLKRVMEHGIMPHIVACRCEQPVLDTVRQKISIYTNVPLRRVFSMHDLPSIYLLPEIMRESGLDNEVVQLLNLGARTNSAQDARAAIGWSEFTRRITQPKQDVTIGITGKVTSLRDSYASIIKALEHSGAAHEARVTIQWIDTSELTDHNVSAALADVDGLLVPGGADSKLSPGKIACIRHARTTGLPFLGICRGFQMAVIEYARNVAGLADADSTERNPATEHPVFDLLTEQKKIIEGLASNMRLGGQDVDLAPGTLAAGMFGGAKKVRLRFRHRYELDPRFVEPLEKAGLVFSGKHPSHPIMQILELPKETHPYFIATQAHPCLTSRPLRAHPMFAGLVAAALTGKTSKT